MSFLDQLHVPRFTTVQVSEATGVNWETMRGWIKRKIVMAGPLEDTRTVKGKGSPYLLSFAQAMQIAITAQFTALGLEPARAGRIASGFACIGDSAFSEEELAQARKPGELYKTGNTFLAAYVGDDLGVVFNANGLGDSSFFQKLFFPEFSSSVRAAVAGVLWVDPIFASLKAGLGVGEEA